MIGDSDNIVHRIKRTLPRGWFGWVSPIRDAILGGLADSAAWNYSLIGYTRAQTRLATAYGIWLDILCFDFLGRTLTRSGLQDGNFRALIGATILQERVTRAGMINAVTKITGLVPSVFEPWNTGDTGAYSNNANGKTCGLLAYSAAGGYGSMNLPAQALMQVHRSMPSGVPDVDGYDGTIAGYGAGSLEYVGNLTQLEGITDQVIYNLINQTKPTGSIMWVAFTKQIQTLTTEDGVVLTDDSSDPLTAQ